MIEKIETLLKHFGKIFREGEHIFYEGDVGSELYLVHSGEVRIYKTIKDRQRTLFIMKKDDFFGEVAALTGTLRTASAIALCETVVIVIPVQVLEKVIESSPEIAARLLKKMAWRLKSADDLIGILMEGDPQVRVVLGLIRLLEINGVASEDGSVSVEFDSFDFATQIDVSTGNVDAVLNQLQERDILNFGSEKMLIIKKPEELEEFYRFLELAKKFGNK